MTHTSGPWNTTGAPQVWAADGSKVAHTSNDANARLIAAAPELLEACLQAVRALPNKPNYVWLVKEMARAAIAKATG